MDDERTVPSAPPRPDDFNGEIIFSFRSLGLSIFVRNKPNVKELIINGTVYAEWQGEPTSDKIILEATEKRNQIKVIISTDGGSTELFINGKKTTQGETPKLPKELRVEENRRQEQAATTIQQADGPPITPSSLAGTWIMRKDGSDWVFFFEENGEFDANVFNGFSIVGGKYFTRGEFLCLLAENGFRENSSKKQLDLIKGSIFFRFELLGNALNLTNVEETGMLSTLGKFTLRKKGDCYIATCVYNTYDCPELWTLRRFRDSVLMKSWFGKHFVSTYYLISPKIVKHFGTKSWFKVLWLTIISNIVKKLQDNGIEDTPYTDE